MNAATRRPPRREPFRIGDLEVAGGRSGTGELPVSRLVTGTHISLPLRVLHGPVDGPTVWLSAAVHGDEVAGVEIIRRVLANLNPRKLRGTVLAVPIVNVHGFLSGDRYLPDRRDLNRSFPGSEHGSLAGRIANLFMKQIVQRCDVGIDLHTGSDHRTNLPQIRADLDDPATRTLAEAFGAPFMLHAKLRDGSMRAAATAAGATVLLFEGGEAWRIDEEAAVVGSRGIRRVLHQLDMIDDDDVQVLPVPVESRSSGWVRARRSGIASMHVGLGDAVARGDTLATIHDSVGVRVSSMKANRTGLVIGHSRQPLVNQGDAIVHIADVGSDVDAIETAAASARRRRSSQDFS
ncbi:MAG: succinylglutamate desuccinylase/aspartoacylase family protein [Ilumatobacter sp.]|uniref:succinylglutamate desuccinylase/aspartoacylase family protein n=1 Tax=Ilumatobacter sp. TaxID=1967498 RepID=UPI001D57B9B7|nr:succinylglutamate desuccinylase/aspartoacylase family protein [Ilumatobacter sp.]MDG1391979.1 succinylglutamate desuccinylase/aspartoacylase family protein [Ilumatobacter sp.]